MVSFQDTPNSDEVTWRQLRQEQRMRSILLLIGHNTMTQTATNLRIYRLFTMVACTTRASTCLQGMTSAAISDIHTLLVLKTYQPL